jgi:HSP20 family molecular chaperone IbpA
MDPGSNDRPNDNSRQSGARDSNYYSRRDSGGSRQGNAPSWGDSAVSGLLQMSREMDRAIQTFFGRRAGSASSSTGTAGTAGTHTAATLWSPTVDVRRQDENVVIHAELPGVQRDAVKIECTSDGITLTGQRHETRTEQDRDSGYYFTERSYGSFHRHIPLPEGAQTEQAKAVMRDGILEITVPVSRDLKRRRIEIEG